MGGFKFHDTEIRVQKRLRGSSNRFKRLRKNWVITLGYIMMVLAIVESSFLFIQAEKLFRTKEADDLSGAAWWLLLVINFLWAIYGWGMKNWALMISGILYVIGAVLVIVAIYLYG